MRTVSSKGRSPSPASSGSARAAARPTWRSSSSTRAAGSTRGSGTTSSCWTRASPRGMRCGCSAGSSASGTSFSSRSARSRPRPRRTRPTLVPGDAPRPRTSWTDSSSSWPARSHHAGLAATVGVFVETSRYAPPFAAAGTSRRAPRLRRRPARAHGRRRDALPRDGAAPSAPPLRPGARGRAPARRRPHRRARPGPELQADQEGRLLGHVHLGLRLIEDRARELDAGDPRRSCSTPSPATTSPRSAAPPRPPCSTTRTSSTPSRRHAPSATDAQPP